MASSEKENGGPGPVQADVRVPRCKHERIYIMELGTMHTSHAREKDGTWTHNSEPGHYIGMLYVECPDCGLERRFSGRRPTWLKKMLESALAA